MRVEIESNARWGREKEVRKGARRSISRRTVPANEGHFVRVTFYLLNIGMLVQQKRAADSCTPTSLCDRQKCYALLFQTELSGDEETSRQQSWTVGRKMVKHDTHHTHLFSRSKPTNAIVGKVQYHSSALTACDLWPQDQCPPVVGSELSRTTSGEI